MEIQQNLSCLPFATVVLRCSSAQHVTMPPQDAKYRPTPEQLLDLMMAVSVSRDRDAFAQIFHYYAPRVKSYIRSLKVEEKSAEDIAQEVLLTVWRRADQYDPQKSALSTWIFTIARNKRIDVARREKRPEIDLNDPALVPEGPASPDRAYDAAQVALRVRAAIETLPQEQATLLRSSFFEEKSHSELADEFLMPLGTVKSRLRLAITKLRSALEDMNQ